MNSNIISAIKYWSRATLCPGQVIEELRTHPSKVAISFWINLLFAILYSITVFIYTLQGRLPAILPWIPIDIEKYYLYQTFWTIPWGLATWIMISGIAHLLSVVGKKNSSRYEYENALVVCGIGWVVPNMICMWIPETLLVPIFGVFWPTWVEMLRLMIVPPIWQIAIVVVGLRKTHEVGWLAGIGIGVVTVAVFFVMFLAFMR